MPNGNLPYGKGAPGSGRGVVGGVEAGDIRGVLGGETQTCGGRRVGGGSGSAGGEDMVNPRKPVGRLRKDKNLS